MWLLTVDGMNCGHCVKAVTEAVLAVDAQAKVEVDLPSKSVRIDSQVPVTTLAAAISEEGYSVLAQSAA